MSLLLRKTERRGFCAVPATFFRMPWRIFCLLVVFALTLISFYLAHDSAVNELMFKA
jgi:hypothetical protein